MVNLTRNLTGDEICHDDLWRQLLDGDRTDFADHLTSHIRTLAGVKFKEFESRVTSELKTLHQTVDKRRSNRVWACGQLLKMHRVGSIVLRGLVDITDGRPSWTADARAAMDNRGGGDARSPTAESPTATIRADNSGGPGGPLGPLCTPLRTPGALSRPSIAH